MEAGLERLGRDIVALRCAWPLAPKDARHFQFIWHLIMLLLVYTRLISQEGETNNHGATHQWPGKPSPTIDTDS